MIPKILTLIWLLVASTPSFAQSVDDIYESFEELNGPKWYFAELSFSAGYGSFSLDNVEEGPTLGTFTPSASFGVHIAGKLYVGASAGVQLVNQYSALTVDGNFRGQRIVLVSPMLAFKLPFGFLKVNYIFLGNYRLLKDTEAGQSVEFSSPQGARLAMSFLRLSKIHLGAFFEKVWFSKTKLNTAESDLSTRMSNFGLELSYRL